MNYIYHWVPKDMRGNTLFPLNTLKEKYPDLYKNEAAKYSGREEIMLHKLPILNCLWNDVLHFSAVNPSVIKQALCAAGRTKSFDLEFFEIDPHILDLQTTIVYLNKHKHKVDKLQEDNFVTFDPDSVAHYSSMPQETKDYYKEMFVQGKNPLLFHKIPHILFKGFLDTSNIKKISV